LHQHNALSLAWCGPITYLKQLKKNQGLKHQSLPKDAIVLK
jgi:hypothetical protein